MVQGGSLSPTSGGGANIYSVSGGLVPRAWGYGSRRALHEGMYYFMQTGAYVVAYGDRLGVGLNLNTSEREVYAWWSTALYGMMGMGATVATIAGAVATGQLWYTLLATAAIPLQLDTFAKTLGSIAKRSRIRLYYERRQQIIAEGLHT